MVWVLDPQKYADVAVHRRYLVPLAGHTGVISSCSTRWTGSNPRRSDDCVKDLRRLLEAEGLADPRILTTSASPAAASTIPRVLVEALSARQARIERLVADIDRIADRFASHIGEAEPPSTIDQKRAARWSTP